MTSLPYTPPPTKQMTSSTPSTDQGTSQKYAPSVPISLYRELASEVKEKQMMLESLQQQNQQLVQQNQQLRGEIEQLVRSVVRLQQIANAYEPPVSIAPPQPRPNQPPLDLSSDAVAPEPESPNPPVDLSAKPNKFPLVTEQEERPYPRPTAPERVSEMNGIGLAIVIFLIAALAGTASFLIVRPLIEQSNPE